MTETKWTPGPWVADRKVAAWMSGDSPGCMVRVWRGNTGKALANCHGRHKYAHMDPDALSDGEAEANASLVAAAPDLYDALEGVLNLEDGASGSQFSAVMNAARDALAKARGETND